LPSSSASQKRVRQIASSGLAAVVRRSTLFGLGPKSEAPTSRSSANTPNAIRRTIAWERESPPTEIDPAEYDYAREDEILAELR